MTRCSPAWIVLVALVFTSCANITVRQLTPEKPYDEGVRFYRPWPYLSVSQEQDANKNPILKAQVIMLPDASPEGEYVVEWKSGWFGTVNPNFNLADGWNMTGFNSKVETNAAALVTSLGSFAGAIGLASTDGSKHEAIGPGLYRMERRQMTTGDKPTWAWVPSLPAVIRIPKPNEPLTE